MMVPTTEQVEAAERLKVPLVFSDTPLAVLRMVELITELQERIAKLEARRK